ncbi:MULTISPECIES: hypothetical protein [Alphaproteobacteria]|uniref:hypothetical protein n=1 Tax=Sphingopyxis sp. TaxID=1908224 RepID=UPI00403344DD
MADGLGNQSQVRTIAEQLFEVWKAEQAREAKEKRKWWQSNVAGWLSAGGIIVGAIIVGNNTYNLADTANARSIRNETAITAMKANSGDRLARIETKIDLMMEERKR